MTENDKEYILLVRYSGCNSFQSPRYPSLSLPMNESDAISAFNEILASGKLGEEYIHWYELRVLNKRKSEIIREWKRDVIENFAEVGATDTIPAARFGDGITKDPSSPFTPNSTEDEKMMVVETVSKYWTKTKDGHVTIISEYIDGTILIEIWKGETLVHSLRFKPFQGYNNA